MLEIVRGGRIESGAHGRRSSEMLIKLETSGESATLRKKE